MVQNFIFSTLFNGAILHPQLLPKLKDCLDLEHCTYCYRPNYICEGEKSVNSKKSSHLFMQHLSSMTSSISNLPTEPKCLDNAQCGKTSNLPPL